MALIGSLGQLRVALTKRTRILRALGQWGTVDILAEPHSQLFKNEQAIRVGA